MSRNSTPSFQHQLAARAAEERRSRRRGYRFKLQFGIRHLMWLSVWTALVLAARSLLVESLPILAFALFAATWAVALGSFLGLIGIAFLAEGGERQDRLIGLVSYCLVGAIAPYLLLPLFGLGWYFFLR